MRQLEDPSSQDQVEHPDGELHRRGSYFPGGPESDGVGREAPDGGEARSPYNRSTWSRHFMRPGYRTSKQRGDDEWTGRLDTESACVNSGRGGESAKTGETGCCTLTFVVADETVDGQELDSGSHMDRVERSQRRLGD